jgi:hypothetical protein
MAARSVNLYEVIDYDNKGKPVSAMDRAVEAFRSGAFMQDAAARIGWPVATLRQWLKVGAEAVSAVAQGKVRAHELTPHQRQCAELHQRTVRAETDARMMMLALVQQQAAGGHTRTETTIRTVNGQATETTTRTIVAAPDARAASWLLAHRWPEDFARRSIEVTGAGGAPIEVDVRSAAERLAEVIEAAGDKAAASAEVVAASNGNGANGNGHHE